MRPSPCSRSRCSSRSRSEAAWVSGARRRLRRAMDDARLTAQADALIAKGSAAPLRMAGEQFASGPKDRLQPGQFAEWRAQSLAFLRSLLPPGHAYLTEFESVTDPRTDT